MAETKQIERFDYLRLLAQVKKRVQLAQQRAIYSANDELPKDSDIIVQLPIAQLEKANTQPPVAQLPKYNFSLPIIHLPWTHNIILIQRVKDIQARYWYMVQSITNLTTNRLGKLNMRYFNSANGFDISFL